MSQNITSFAERAELAQRLKDARLAAGVKIVDLHPRAGVSRQTVYNVENATENAPVRLLRAYSVLCHLDLDLLLIAWGYLPDDVFGLLQRQPELVKELRLKHILSAELTHAGG